ncbi:MAG: hypothetical protein ACXW30_02250 [Micavibrio sp.]
MTNTVTTRNTKQASIFSHGRTTEQIVLPLPPVMTDLAVGQDTRFEMEVYARFMRHLRNVPNSRMEIKILSSIQFTADMLDIGEELVAKTLADLGLKAPRKAFPGSFLEFCDKCLLRRSLEGRLDDFGGTPNAVLLLKDHWDSIGEDRFGPLPIKYAVFNEGLLISR